MSARILNYRRPQAAEPDPKKSGRRPAQVVALPRKADKPVTISRHGNDDRPPEAA